MRGERGLHASTVSTGVSHSASLFTCFVLNIDLENDCTICSRPTNARNASLSCPSCFLRPPFSTTRPPHPHGIFFWRRKGKFGRSRHILFSPPLPFSMRFCSIPPFPPQAGFRIKSQAFTIIQTSTYCAFNWSRSSVASVVLVIFLGNEPFEFGLRTKMTRGRMIGVVFPRNAWCPFGYCAKIRLIAVWISVLPYIKLFENHPRAISLDKCYITQSIWTIAM